MSPGSTGRILTDGNALPHLYQERYGHGSDYDEAEKPVKDFIKYERSEGLSIPHFEWNVKPRYTYRDGKYVTRCAPPSDRLAALKAFNAAGIFTWISLEPVLDPVRSLEVIDACHEFVSLFKVGKPNYIKTDGNIDWADFTRRCVDRCESLGKKLYVKESLQGHLPEGFVNEMRVKQHF